MDCGNYREFVNLPLTLGEVSHSDGEGLVAEPRLLSSPHTTNIDFSRVRLTFVVHLSGIEIYNPRRMNIFGWNRGRPERAGVA